MTHFNDFLLWEATSRDTIDFKKIYVDMADDLVAGLLLSQIVYWYLPNKQGESKLRVHKDGFDWIAKGREDWYEEIRISPKQFDRAAKILESKGLIAKANYRFNGMRTVHIRLKTDEFMEAWNYAIAAKDTPVLPKGKDRSYPKVKTEIDESVRPITESTAKTTKDNGAAKAATPEPTTSSPKKEADFLPPAEVQMGLLFAGRTNGSTAAHEEAERTLQRSGWDIRSKSIKDAAIHFIAATGWEVPHTKPIRGDWLKDLKTHVDEFGADKLYSLYTQVLRTADFTLSRPGSFTRAMLAIKNNSHNNHPDTGELKRVITDDWATDPQVTFFIEAERLEKLEREQRNANQ